MTRIKSKLLTSLWVVLIIIMAHFVAYCNQSGQLEDVVYLKNGSVIHGTIVEQVPGISLKIETLDGNVFVYRIEEVRRIVKEPIRISAYKSRKDGVVALCLSLLIPGGGQFYNGEGDKGAVMLGMSILGIAFVTLESGSSDYYYEDGSRRPSGNAAVGAFLWLGGALWSLIDAPVSSARINRENGLASAYRISDKLYVNVGVAGFGSQEKTFVKAIILF